MNLETPEIIAACESGDFSAAAALVNADAQPTRKATEAARYTWLGLQDKFGVDRVTGWRVALRLAMATAEAANNIATAESLSMFRETMAGAGYSFSDERTQAQLAALRDAGIVSSSDFDELSALGFVPAAVVTAEQVEAEWGERQSALNRADFDALWNEHASPVLSNRSALADALETIATAMRG